MPNVFKPLEQLILYRNLLHDPVISLCRKMADNHWAESDKTAMYCEACYHLFVYYDRINALPDLWRNYILGLIIADENPFALACERAHGKTSPALLEAGSHDLQILYPVINFDWAAFGKSLGLPAVPWFEANTEKSTAVFAINPWYASALQSLNIAISDPTRLVSAFVAFYQQNGCGDPAIYRAFNWDGKLRGIACPDPVHLADLIGYESQKQALRENTEAFLAGRGGNHVLLFGDKGTGKSSSVKALLNEYTDKALHMIELQRQQLAELNMIIALLRQRSGFYIIFIDDLSFEDFEVEYKYLKSHIEGSLQAPADNVRFYVTSNRRHLIRENWNERDAGEVHAREAQQEKLSFADRFGLTLTYTSPLQDEYLQMVRVMAENEGLVIESEVLDRLALQWELRYHGRSGRSARQFINDLKGRIG